MRLLQHKLIRFAVIGAGVAGAYVLLYLGLLATGLPQAIANGLAFLLAVMLQYVGQAAFTFKQQLNDGAQIIRFAAMVALGFFTSALITGPVAAATGLADWIAAATVTVILPVQNFVFMKFWVFASPRSKTEIKP